MEKVRIAYVTTHQADVFPFISAFREILDEVGEVAEVRLRSGEDLVEADQLEEFVRFASTSHLLILHLHGGKKSLYSLTGGCVARLSPHRGEIQRGAFLNGNIQ